MSLVTKISSLIPGSSIRSKNFQQLLGYAYGSLTEPTIQVPVEALTTDSLPDFQPTAKQLIVATAVHLVHDFPFICIHAGPGTGKTLLAAILVRCILLADTEVKILIAAPTNRAACNIGVLLNELAEKEKYPLLQPLRMYARGRENRPDGKTQPCDPFSVHYLATHMEENVTDEIENVRIQLQSYTAELAELKFQHSMSDEEKYVLQLDIVWKESMVHDLTSHLHKWVISTFYQSILITTCATALDDRIKDMTFDYVIVDEAGAANLIEICAAASKLDQIAARQLILIGDEKQLRPYSHGFGVAGDCASTSALALLKERKNVTSFSLDYCFRMHPDLLSFPNDSFYNGTLKSALTTSDRTLLIGRFPFPEKHCPLLFCSLKSTDKLALGRSRVNLAEIDAIVEILKFLLTYCNLNISQIAVLTFYDGQRIALIARITAEFGAEMAAQVFVVDGFQGRQIDVAILSVVRANAIDDEDTIGFLHSAERLNVSLTRVKHGLIIVGNTDTLGNASELWESFLYYLGEWGLVQPDFHKKLDSYSKLDPNLWYNSNRLVNIDRGLFTQTI